MSPDNHPGLFRRVNSALAPLADKSETDGQTDINPLTWRGHLLVFGIYLLLTIVFTYPLAFRIGSHLPGVPPDNYLYAWDMEWVKHALFDPDASLFFTTAMYYPEGVGLYFHQLVLGTNLLLLPLQLSFGLVSSYAVMTLIMFVLSGYAAFLLAFQVVRHWGAALFAGIVFTFSPYHLTHLFYAHFDLMAIQWLPLFALASIRLFKRLTIEHLLLVLTFLIWNSITDWYYALYAVIFFSIYLLDRIIRQRSLQPLVQALFLGGAYLAALSWWFLPMLNEIRQGGAALRGTIEADKFSADLFGFFIPSILHPIWGRLVEPLASQMKGGFVERTLFVGYTTLALSIVAIVKVRSREIIFWSSAALLFFVLALGPVLHVGGRTDFDGLQIPLPYALIRNIPFVSTVLNIARSIGRFGLMGLLCLAIVAAFGIRELSRSAILFGRKGSTGRLALAASLLVGIEFLVIPIFVTDAAVSPSVNALAQDKDNYAILDLPVDYRTGAEAMYYWTVTHKPSTNGYHSQLLAFPLIESQSTFRPLMEPSEARDILTSPKPSAVQVLNFFNIRTVALHQNADARAVSVSSRWVRENIGTLPFKFDDRLSLYSVPLAASPPFVTFLEGEWYPPGEWSDGRIWRWMGNDAQVVIHVHRTMRVSLRVETISLDKPRTLRFMLNGEPIGEDEIAHDLITPVELPELSLRDGANILSLHSVEPAEQPARLGINNDPRFLSVAFSKLTVKSK